MDFFKNQQKVLSPDERAVRDSFVDEYFFDFDPFAACLRIGLTAEAAQQCVPTFMAEGYVQNKIKEKMHSRSINSETEKENDRALIINTLRQASQKGPFVSRVSAAKALAEMRGLTEDGKDDPASQLVEAFKKIASEVS